ncbi:tRNA pseudouridine(55) synthase TruB [Halioxenophilus sp. WMMB6]|uniref:tRNA pseudouridine(55) synthase TruB n=1 Tax=Halioxenophilus sp. WMMB6 TaxID=3073815 RepID=UPI00295F2277|nr:tRNA pseudouridine(55) synthase TruB [Halioxenophilus sp. WMMB6]
MAKKSNRRPVHGVLVLDKPLGLSSNQALQQAKRLFNAAKAGHTGALDPLATGVLPLCFGEATKFSQYLLDADKGYLATFRLGLETASGDLDADVVAEADASAITGQQVEAAVAQFRGAIEQVPPMFSALKHQGQPLYKLARSGQQIERAPRQVTLYDYRVTEFRPGPQAELDVVIHCSKGTYVRSLALDLGYKLGVGATVVKLRRSQAGPFTLAQVVTLEQLAELAEAGPEVLDGCLQPVDAPVDSLPQVELPESSCFYFRQGQAVLEQKVYRFAKEGDKVRVFSEAGDFLGIGEVEASGRVAPRRVVSCG